jgi:glutamate-1-semialdehyde 2,1-aminomutase
MSVVSPLGGVYQAGTLSGNPISVAAGMKTLELVLKPGFFDSLGEKTKRLVDGLAAAARRHSVTFSADAVGGMFGVFFRPTPPDSFAEVMAGDKDAFNRFFHAALTKGVYFAPSAFEAGFVSSAHGEREIEETIRVADEIFGAASS